MNKGSHLLRSTPLDVLETSLSFSSKKKGETQSP